MIKRNKGSSGNNRGTKIKVWWQEKKKRTQSARNINPLPPLSGTIYWQGPLPITRGTALCPPVHFWHRWTPATHAVPNRARYHGLAKGFGAIYCQPQQTAICAEPSMVGFQEEGESQIMCPGESKETGYASQLEVKRRVCCGRIQNFFLHPVLQLWQMATEPWSTTRQT